MRSKTVPFEVCECGKRGWTEERDADKALGRARAKRHRNYGHRRGLVVESRHYVCEFGMFHLTHQSRRQHQMHMEATA